MLGNNDSSSTHSRRGVLKGLGVLGATAIGSSALSGSATAGIGDSAVYQYYHTDWETIRQNLSAVADAGYDAIQVPPAQFSRLYEYERQFDSEVYHQPLGYQPIDFTDFDSVFGTEAEYAAMVEEAHTQGLDVIADAVMNHLAAAGDTFDRQVSIDDIPRFSNQDFHEGCAMDYQDPDSVENCWLVGLRDLDQDSSYVRGELYNYLAKYADLGVDGIRFDAAKHMSERFFRDYANQWADQLGLYRVGEVLDGSTSMNQQYADTGMSVTDFSLYFTMREDVFHSSGDMRALEGAGLVNQSPTRAMTFVSNHDKKPPDYEKLAYAYILTYEGYPRVYNHRIDASDQDISNLLWIRRNVLSGSATTRYVDSDLYVFERGDGLVVLNRGDSQRSEWVETSFGANTKLSDCTGSVSDVQTNDTGYVKVTAPAVGYAVYSTACLDDGTDDTSNDDTSDDETQSSELTLQVEAPTAEGESVYFTGGTEALTNWGSGFEGTLNNGVWEVTVEDTGDFEWKTRRGSSGGSGDVWEAGANHSSTTPSPTHNGWSDGFDGGSEDSGSDDGTSDDQEDDQDTTEQTPINGGRTYVIRSAKNGLALDVQNVSYDNGANVHTWAYLDGHRPQWMVESVGDGYYRLLTTHSGKALDVEMGSTADGANVHQWRYVGGDNQQFSIEETSGGYLLRARHSDKVLEVSGTENGANVTQNSETGDDSQVWTFEAL